MCGANTGLGFRSRGDVRHHDSIGAPIEHTRDEFRVRRTDAHWMGITYTEDVEAVRVALAPRFESGRFE